MIEGKNRIMIFGPKADGTYVIEFRTAKGEVLAISVPRGETAVPEHFQTRMPYGVFVPDAQNPTMFVNLGLAISLQRYERRNT